MYIRTYQFNFTIITALSTYIMIMYMIESSLTFLWIYERSDQQYNLWEGEEKEMKGGREEGDGEQ